MIKLKNYQRMIRKFASSYKRKYPNMEYEDLEAQAYLIFCETLQKYDPTKSKFSTKLYWELKKLTNYCTYKKYGRGQAIGDFLIKEVRYEYVFEQVEFYLTAKQTLSAKGYKVLNSILNGEIKNRNQALMYFKNKNWKYSIISKAWNEIKNFWINYKEDMVWV